HHSPENATIIIGSRDRGLNVGVLADEIFCAGNVAGSEISGEAGVGSGNVAGVQRDIDSTRQTATNTNRSRDPACKEVVGNDGPGRQRAGAYRDARGGAGSHGFPCDAELIGPVRQNYVCLLRCVEAISSEDEAAVVTADANRV